MLSAACAGALVLAVAPMWTVGAVAEPSVPDAVAPAWTYDPNEFVEPGDIAARAITESVDQAEAERRFRVERAAADLQVRAEALWPATFAGLWMEIENFGVVAAFTRDAEANVALLRAQFPFPAELRSKTAAVPLATLLANQRELGEERTRLQRGERPAAVPADLAATAGRFDLDVDVPNGALVVAMERPSERVSRDLGRRFGHRVDLRTGIARPRACTQGDCRYAMMGGIELEIPGSGCSSAFTAVSGSTRFVLSAGHCYAETGQRNRSNGGALYGSMSSYRYSGNVDAERVTKSNTTWRESSKFFVTNENPRLVTSYTTYANTVINAYLGKTGNTTATTRGYVTSKTVAPSYVSGAYNFVQADMCSDFGDSGGAIWSSNSAYGILSGGPIARCRNINGTLITHPSSSAGPTIFGSIQPALSALGVSLLTGVNLAPKGSYTSSCLLLNCTFDASASYDEDGSITSYRWDFGDGTTGSGRVVSHSYALPGFYTVSLVVTDNNGARATDSESQLIYVQAA